MGPSWGPTNVRGHDAAVANPNVSAHNEQKKFRTYMVKTIRKIHKIIHNYLNQCVQSNFIYYPCVLPRTLSEEWIADSQHSKRDTRNSCRINPVLQLLYYRGKSLRYPSFRGLGSPKSWSGRGGQEKNHNPPANPIKIEHL